MTKLYKSSYWPTMAATAHPDIQQPEPQQQQQQQQQEWTQVRRKQQPRHRNAGKKSQLKAPPPPVTRPDNTAAAAHLSVSDIQKDHDRFENQWRESTCLRRLNDLVTSNSSKPKVTRAVCLGIGSFDPEDGAWEVKRRAHVQLAAFLSIVAGFQSQGEPSTIQCFFQEPLFTASDRDFVRSLGHEVVESPRGFEMVDRETLVFGIHLYRDIYSQAISRSVPAVFIGTGLNVWEE